MGKYRICITDQCRLITPIDSPLSATERFASFVWSAGSPAFFFFKILQASNSSSDFESRARGRSLSLLGPNSNAPTVFEWKNSPNFRSKPKKKQSAWLIAGSGCYFESKDWRPPLFGRPAQRQEQSAAVSWQIHGNRENRWDLRPLRLRLLTAWTTTPCDTGDVDKMKRSRLFCSSELYSIVYCIETVSKWPNCFCVCVYFEEDVQNMSCDMFTLSMAVFNNRPGNSPDAV